MTNLTISLDEAVVRQARIRAIGEGTSVSAKVREFLQAYVNGGDQTAEQQRKDATASLMASIEQATAQSVPLAAVSGSIAARKRSLREEIYEDDFRGHPAFEAASAPVHAKRA